MESYFFLFQCSWPSTFSCVSSSISWCEKADQDVKQTMDGFITREKNGWGPKIQVMLKNFDPRGHRHSGSNGQIMQPRMHVMKDAIVKCLFFFVEK